MSCMLYVGSGRRPHINGPSTKIGASARFYQGNYKHAMKKIMVKVGACVSSIILIITVDGKKVEWKERKYAKSEIDSMFWRSYFFFFFSLCLQYPKR